MAMTMFARIRLVGIIIPPHFTRLKDKECYPSNIYCDFVVDSWTSFRRVPTETRDGKPASTNPYVK
uniref:Tyrosine-protein phosphatase domain-containing protein n=1 Tax=Heterorhabditis bacteriophora TaxID=37862 RepID=A0A1I7WX21_HETBA